MAIRALHGYTITCDIIDNTKNILISAGLNDWRVSCLRRSFIAPAPEFVLNKLLNFDKDNALSFSKSYLQKYEVMMSNILNAFTK